MVYLCRSLINVDVAIGEPEYWTWVMDMAFGMSAFTQWRDGGAVASIKMQLKAAFEKAETVRAAQANPEQNTSHTAAAQRLAYI